MQRRNKRDLELSDDWHDIEIDEWMKFLFHVLMNPDFEDTSKLFRNFLEENTEMFAFQDVLDSNQIKYDKISFW
jgi:hypothetical protein